MLFDEKVISAQQVARLMATTPHMMGDGMQYTGAFVLKVSGINDTEKAQAAKDALLPVKGVGKVRMYPKQQAVAVEFLDEGGVTTQQLIRALSEAGLAAGEFR